MAEQVSVEQVRAKLAEWINRDGQASVARQMGCSKSYVCYMQHGKRPPSAEVLRRLGFRKEGKVYVAVDSEAGS